MNSKSIIALLFIILPLTALASDHSFTGLPLTPTGWTDFREITASGYETSRVVFVSNSDGNDSTGQSYGISDITFDANGMFQPSGSVNAYKTIAAGYGQIRNGSPDILLLKRGEEYNEQFSLGSVGRWTKSGPSSTNRLILASYGTGSRPTILAGGRVGFTTVAAQNLIVSGIRFYNDTWETVEDTKAIDVLGSYQWNQLYEDCVIEKGWVRMQGDSSSKFYHNAFRRCNFVEPITPAIYAEHGEGLLMEESLYYSPVGKVRWAYLSPSDTTDHHSLTGVRVIGNIGFYSNAGAFDMRAGGELLDNTMVRIDEDNARFGGDGGSRGSIQSGTVANNVYLESTRSLFIKNNDGTSVHGNIWTDAVGTTYDAAILIAGDDQSNVHVARNLDIHNNIIYGWNRPSDGQGYGIYFYNLVDVVNVNVHDNDIQAPAGSVELQYVTNSPMGGMTFTNNRYYSSAAANKWFKPGLTLAGWVTASGETGAQALQVSYPYPNRNLKTYNQSLGGEASTDEFMEEVLLQSRTNWRPQYTAAAANDYVRAGFGMAGQQRHSRGTILFGN